MAVVGRHSRGSSLLLWVVLGALLWSTSVTLAASPPPSPGAGGDPRSSGQGPGLVGDPGFALLAVVLIGVDLCPRHACMGPAHGASKHLSGRARRARRVSARRAHDSPVPLRTESRRDPRGPIPRPPEQHTWSPFHEAFMQKPFVSERPCSRRHRSSLSGMAKRRALRRRRDHQPIGKNCEIGRVEASTSHFLCEPCRRTTPSDPRTRPSR